MIKQKALDAGAEAEDFNNHFAELKIEESEGMTEDEKRGARVKNLSLQLLSANTPKQVLDLFEKLNEQPESIFVEELFMLLYFFNSQCRSMHEAHVERILKEDYRVGLLIATLFDKFNPETVELTYQVSTIHALTMLHRFYGLDLRDD